MTSETLERPAETHVQRRRILSQHDDRGATQDHRTGRLGDVTDDTWGARGNPACGTTWCARWTIENYLRAGFTP